VRVVKLVALQTRDKAMVRFNEWLAAHERDEDTDDERERRETLLTEVTGDEVDQMSWGYDVRESQGQVAFV